MRQWIGDKLCEFSVNANGQAVVDITFPNAKIFQPQKDGTMKIMEGKRRATHTSSSLTKLMNSCKDSGQLPAIASMLKLFAATNTHGTLKIEAKPMAEQDLAQQA